MTLNPAPSNLLFIYIHGFLSSPESSKARQLAQWLAAEGIAYACPALDISPLIALDQIEQIIEEAQQRGLHPRLIGSSLGGAYATHLMSHHPARTQMRAVLINPAVAAERDLASQVGIHKSWHSDAQLEFTNQHVEDLRLLQGGDPDPKRLMVVAATGDELLDWKEMVDRFPHSEHLVVQGSDHGLSDFEVHWPKVREFLLRP